MIVERQQSLDKGVAIDAVQLVFEQSKLIPRDSRHDGIAVVQRAVEIEENGLNHKGIANSPMINPVLCARMLAMRSRRQM